MSELVSESQASASAGGEFEALAGLNDGFLGTGSSTMVELSYVAMALIGAYLVIGTVRYFISGRSLAAKVAEAFGLR